MMFLLCKRGEFVSDLSSSLKWRFYLDTWNMQEENLMLVSLLLMVEKGLETT